MTGNDRELKRAAITLALDKPDATDDELISELQTAFPETDVTVFLLAARQQIRQIQQRSKWQSAVEAEHDMEVSMHDGHNDEDADE